MPEEEQEQHHEPKISLPEIIFGTMFFGIFDAIELIIVFFGLDDFWIFDTICLSVGTFYLTMKGVAVRYDVTLKLLEFIPYFGALPLKTIGFLATVYIDRYPKLAAVASKAAGATGVAAAANVAANPSKAVASAQRAGVRARQIVQGARETLGEEGVALDGNEVNLQEAA